MRGDGDDFDLSGLWHGRFSFPRLLDPISFVATLLETDGWLSGSTEEVGRAGDAKGKSISATLQGRRQAGAVTFLKTYDGRYRGYDAVCYDGAISADGTEIVGRWNIPGSWSGTFLMIRPGGIAEAIERETADAISS